MKWDTSIGLVHDGPGLHCTVVPSLSLRGPGLCGGLLEGCMVDLAHGRMDKVLGFVPVP
jgi:hypothetical protein